MYTTQHMQKYKEKYLKIVIINNKDTPMMIIKREILMKMSVNF